MEAHILAQLRFSIPTETLLIGFVLLLVGIIGFMLKLWLKDMNGWKNNINAKLDANGKVIQSIDRRLIRVESHLGIEE
jgi:hypothetical protein